MFMFPRFTFVKVSLFWMAGNVLIQHVALDIGYNEPFVVTYMGSCAVSMLLPVYFGMSRLGLVYNPPWRDETGWYITGGQERR